MRYSLSEKSNRFSWPGKIIRKYETLYSIRFVKNQFKFVGGSLVSILLDGMHVQMPSKRRKFTVSYSVFYQFSSKFSSQFVNPIKETSSIFFQRANSF